MNFILKLPILPCLQTGGYFPEGKTGRKSCGGTLQARCENDFDWAPAASFQDTNELGMLPVGWNIDVLLAQLLFQSLLGQSSYLLVIWCEQHKFWASSCIQLTILRWLHSLSGDVSYPNPTHSALVLFKSLLNSEGFLIKKMSLAERQKAANYQNLLCILKEKFWWEVILRGCSKYPKALLKMLKLASFFRQG